MPDGASTTLLHRLPWMTGWKKAEIHTDITGSDHCPVGLLMK
jgi:exonuclease III